MDFNSIIPFRNKDEGYLSNLHNEVDKVFNSFLKGIYDEGSLRNISPNVDISETDKELKVTAELPGVKEEDLSITLNDNILTMTGEKKMEKEEKGKTFHKIERSYGQFSRSFTIPFKANSDTVEASFEKGLLNIVIPKPEGTESRANKIAIKKKN